MDFRTTVWISLENSVLKKKQNNQIISPTDDDEVNELMISQQIELHFEVQDNNKVEQQPSQPLKKKYKYIQLLFQSNAYRWISTL